MNSNIFREYDIRGIADEEIRDEDVLLLGKGMGTYFGRENCSRIVVGRDCRLTSDRYRGLLTEGLLSTGCDVVDIGICPTPVFYFAIREMEMDGGMMITASHNPPEYNGFKICRGNDSLFGDQIRKLYRIIQAGDFTQGRGQITDRDPVPSYMDYLEKNIRIPRPLRVGVDAGNGTAGVVAVPLLKALGCEVHDLYCDMDGHFPNHESDPTVLENMRDLAALVRNNGLDLGIGYDGDGDRIGIVDEGGNILWGDQLMIIYAREILSRRPGVTIISEVKSSQVLYDDIERHGGKPVMWKTGHSLIKQKMKELGAALAGEMSGHMFFADRYFGYDDALYATCRLLEIVASAERPVSHLLTDLPPVYNTPEIRIPCPDDQKFSVVGEITEYFRQRRDVIDVDGVRVRFENGWGLVRASNTQPVLVLRFEAFSEKALADIRAEVEAVLNDISRERHVSCGPTS